MALNVCPNVDELTKSHLPHKSLFNYFYSFLDFSMALLPIVIIYRFGPIQCSVYSIWSPSHLGSEVALFRLELGRKNQLGNTLSQPFSIIRVRPSRNPSIGFSVEPTLKGFPLGGCFTNKATLSKLYYYYWQPKRLLSCLEMDSINDKPMQGFFRKLWSRLSTSSDEIAKSIIEGVMGRLNWVEFNKDPLIKKFFLNFEGLQD